MPSRRNLVIGGLIAVAILVLGAIGIYFATKSGKSEKNDPNDTSADELLIKSVDGTITSYARKSKTFSGMKIHEKLFGIVSFGPYANETIYYATSEAGSVIKSTNNKVYPDLPKFTADWMRTAIVVDDVTKKVYVVDRAANEIKVVEGNRYTTLPLELSEPLDLILAPESGNMFVLEKSKIIMADMDGTNKATLVEANNIQAITADTQNGIVYFAHQEGIESYDSRSKKRTVVNGAEAKIKSLAYSDKALYFINKKGKSSKKTGTSLGNCRLDESECPGQCCNVFTVYESEKLEQVKIYKSEKPKAKNPCGKENGGCQHFCLLNSSKEGQSCACNQGWTLRPDNKTCG